MYEETLAVQQLYLNEVRLSTVVNDVMSVQAILREHIQCSRHTSKRAPDQLLADDDPCTWHQDAAKI